MYNDENVFAKILSGAIPCKKIYENDTVLSFYDINPKSKIHALVIPKGKYIDFHNFMNNASSDEISEFFTTVNHIATNVLKLKDFRIQTNNGSKAGQEVFHFHIHILG